MEGLKLTRLPYHTKDDGMETVPSRMMPLKPDSSTIASVKRLHRKDISACLAMDNVTSFPARLASSKDDAGTEVLANGGIIPCQLRRFLCVVKTSRQATYVRSTNKE